jgi:predicted nucleic acid-binding protein
VYPILPACAKIAGEKVIISDTSCLIALTNTGHFDVLKEVFGAVVITPEVLGEYGDPLPEWITVRSVSDTNRIKLIQNVLDLGANTQRVFPKGYCGGYSQSPQ